MTKSCPVCGSELKPLFSSLQCFNERCGQASPISKYTEARLEWTRLFDGFGLVLPDDIEVVKCEPYITQNAWNIAYRLKGAEWYGAQVVYPNALAWAAKSAPEFWDYMRMTRPTNPAAQQFVQRHHWSVP